VSEGLRSYLPDHDCQTARYAGLLALNGELLVAAETAKFDVVLTVDRGFEYQQNLERRKIAIIIFVGSRSFWKTSCPSFRMALPNSKRSSPAKSSESVVSDSYLVKAKIRRK
jgi:hypothetical protein